LKIKRFLCNFALKFLCLEKDFPLRKRGKALFLSGRAKWPFTVFRAEGRFRQIDTPRIAVKKDVSP